MFRKNVAGQHLGLALLNASTGAALTGATVTAVRAIDGGAQAAVTGSVAEAGGGQYIFSPSAADTNGNQISFLFTATGAIPVEKTIITTTGDPTLGLVNTVFNGVIVSTNNDKSNYSLAVAPPTAAQVRAEIDSGSTQLAAVKAKTDALPTDPADASDVAAAFGIVNGTLATISGYLDTEVAAIKAKTDALPASPAGVGSPMTLADSSITNATFGAGAIDANAIATDAFGSLELAASAAAEIAAAVSSGLSSLTPDAIAAGLLKFDVSTITGEARRSLLNAMRFFLNRWYIADGILTICKENDATTAWDATIATDANGNVTDLDPN